VNWQPLGAFESSLHESVGDELERCIDSDFPDLFLLDDPIGDKALMPQELLAELRRFESSLALGVIWIEEPADLDTPLIADWAARAIRSNVTPDRMVLDSTTLEPGPPLGRQDRLSPCRDGRNARQALGSPRAEGTCRSPLHRRSRG